MNIKFEEKSNVTWHKQLNSLFNSYMYIQLVLFLSTYRHPNLFGRADYVSNHIMRYQTWLQVYGFVWDWYWMWLMLCDVA